jgi:hypothetical protein
MPHFECGAFDHSATSPHNWSALDLRGVSHSDENSGWQGRKSNVSGDVALTDFGFSRISHSDWKSP